MDDKVKVIQLCLNKDMPEMEIERRRHQAIQKMLKKKRQGIRARIEEIWECKGDDKD